MADFLIAYNITLGYEGKYSNDPGDSGGETYKGISRVHWPNWRGWEIIDGIFPVFGKIDLVTINKKLSESNNLQSEVQNFYKKEFWDKALLSKLPQNISNEIFDTGVNQGLERSVRYFQESLNMLNNNQKYYSDIPVIDGKLGNLTLKIFEGYMNTAKIPGRNELRNIATIIKLLNALQLYRYISVIKDNPKQEKFMYGWINRT